MVRVYFHASGILMVKVGLSMVFQFDVGAEFACAGAVLFVFNIFSSASPTWAGVASPSSLLLPVSTGSGDAVLSLVIVRRGIRFREASMLGPLSNFFLAISFSR